MSFIRLGGSVAVITTSLLVAPNALCADAAPRASYARVDELGSDGTPHQADLALSGKFLRFGDDPAGLRNVAVFDVRERTLVGRSLAYAAGLDLTIGGSSSGLTYGGTLYPVGLGARFGNGGMLSLAGGVGGDRVGSAAPLALRLPIELSVSASLGSIRQTLWVRPSWIAGADERRRGAPSTSRIDELEAGLTFRFGAQRRYWSETNAGRGLAFGIVYRELMGARAIGVVLGLELSGGR